MDATVAPHTENVAPLSKFAAAQLTAPPLTEMAPPATQNAPPLTELAPPARPALRRARPPLATRFQSVSPAPGLNRNMASTTGGLAAPRPVTGEQPAVELPLRRSWPMFAGIAAAALVLGGIIAAAALGLGRAPDAAGHRGDGSAGEPSSPVLSATAPPSTITAQPANTDRAPSVTAVASAPPPKSPPTPAATLPKTPTANPATAPAPSPAVVVIPALPTIMMPAQPNCSPPYYINPSDGHRVAKTGVPGKVMRVKSNRMNVPRLLGLGTMGGFLAFALSAAANPSVSETPHKPRAPPAYEQADKLKPLQW